jgi:hypothetical protein
VRTIGDEIKVYLPDTYVVSKRGFYWEADPTCMSHPSSCQQLISKPVRFMRKSVDTVGSELVSAAFVRRIHPCADKILVGLA